MFKVLQVSTGYTDGSVEKEIIEKAGGSYRLIASEAEADIIAAGRDANGLIIALTQVPKTLIDALPELKVILRAGIGVDNIDLDAAKARGIKVYNLPNYCQDEVADHTMALLLALERRLAPQVLDLRGGQWMPVKQYMPIMGLKGAKLGFVGCGGIAQKVMERARPFGLQLIGYDPYLPAARAAQLGLELMDLDGLLRSADFISLHVPLTPETRHILGREAFGKMKPNAYVINTARGPLIDNDALYDALAAGRIFGAALDVVDGDLEGAKRFAGFGNVLLTPHTAYYSELSNVNIKAQAGQLMADFMKGEVAQAPIV